MVYKKLYLSIIIRVSLIILSSIWFAFSIIPPFRIYSLIVISSLIVIQGYLLVQLINRFNRDVYSYFYSLRDEGTSTHFKVKGDSQNELYNLINDVGRMIHDARIAKEKQFQYLNFIVNTIPFGIIITDLSGKVILSNNYVKKLLSLDAISNIDILEIKFPAVYKLINKLQVGEKELIRVKLMDQSLRLSVSKWSFKIEDDAIQLFTFQDVRAELEENEIKAWQKLVRVLNHELMNSITPIITLSHAIKRTLSELGKDQFQDNASRGIAADILKNTELIEERSQGLVKFIGNYRTLISNKNLEESDFFIYVLLNKVEPLFHEELQKSKITLSVEVDPKDLKLNADANMLEQVLINLVRNAIESMESSSNHTIKIAAKINSAGRIEISVADNGRGIDDSILDDIFVPFYTTKRDGSGVGLSFSKQVMRMHGGEILVQTEPGKGSVFTLVF